MSKPEKKSERLEIRLPFSTKQAFVEACERRADTPSGSIRRFIDSYIKQSDNELLSKAFTALKRRLFRPVPVIATVACLLAVTMAITYWNGQPDTQEMKVTQLFTAYDIDQSGALEVGEISTLDHYLHTAMDDDNSGSITLDEFRTDGDLIILYADKSSVKKTERDIQMANLEPPRLIEYNLWNKENPTISVWQHHPDTLNITADKIVMNYERPKT